ncbi:hypothetical protein JG687_00008903 [Phytophthora cactorum]|uniref:Uncharacterized protein n=1 Tax=Phytophthora cactorum TaxID=29920 RepID=A0A329RTK4_9STRA|nr:hypothetical protein Pcac1_g22798 [Phytophthora cactorum]KAG2813876.1 hypothetical protein PC112_g14551 [Phytophthora cactorum]KAG2815591.1 hypothetical protein PC111_g13500 [Phytophthora cactorum]KAG2852803.1 hypothetical protein PC113_g14705 [Phytophthora cactorum]KAG2894518.1 hypothetical protein PC114_g15873 [Phytophthora cactorum]
MALRARTTKRARPQTSPSAKHVSCDDVYFRQPGLVENQHDDKPRRKRAMVSANLRFLEKMPPLRDYQRGRFGRRGGVDGGAPHATDEGSSLWMRALEESMEETSFVTREAPTCAALVAPVPIPVDNRRNTSFVPVPVAVMGAGRVGISASPRFSNADEDAIRRRRLFALQAARGGGKDDEARPATEGLAL